MQQWWNKNKPQQNNTDVDSADNRIDPNRYADLLIREVLTSIGRAVEAGKSLKEAFSIYTLSVQNLEAICYASNWLDEKIQLKYEERIKTYLLKNNIEDVSKLDENGSYHLHRVKFQFLLTEIFGNQLKYLELEI